MRALKGLLKGIVWTFVLGNRRVRLHALNGLLQQFVKHGLALSTGLTNETVDNFRLVVVKAHFHDVLTYAFRICVHVVFNSE